MLAPVGLPWLEEGLREFPDTVFIGHGPGWWAEISRAVTGRQKSGYPAGPVRPPGSIDRLLAQYPHLFADLSAHSACNRDRSHARRFVPRPYAQLLFGNDRCGRRAPPVMLGLLKEMRLPRAVAASVFTRDAERLLRLPEEKIRA